MKPAASVATIERQLRAGLQAQAAGRLGEAAGLYRRVLAVHPSCADAAHLLSQVRYLEGRGEEALALVSSALAIAPSTAIYLNTRGAILRALSRPADALVDFRRALALDPRHAGARKSLAGALAESGAPDGEVADAFVAAAALAPGDPECWLGAGIALHRAGRHAEAAAAAERATILGPASVEALDAWFAAAKAADGLALLEERLSALAAARPDSVEITLRLVDARVELGAAERAEEASLGLATRVPLDARAWQRRGIVLQETGRTEQAIEAFSRAIALSPDDEVSDQRLGNCLVKLERLDDALAHYRRHLARFPHVALSWNNAAVVLCRLDRDEEALGFFDRAVEADASLRIARASRAMARMRLGMLHDGWDDYRFREVKDVPLSGQRWPRALAGRRIHVRAEQGVGDQVYFLRFARLAVERGATLSVDVVGKLAGMAGRMGFAVAAEAPAGAEVVAMGDLPWLLDCGDADFPAPIPVPALAGSVERARLLLAGMPRPVSGVTWRAGGVRGQRDTVKLVPPEALGAALRDAPGTIVSLQRLPGEGEHAAFEAGLGRKVPDLSACNDDLELMLALMGELDAYAGVSNANLHLRCAAGRGSDILSTFPLDWRWMRSADGGVPWYPGCRAYRQDVDGGWRSALPALSAAARLWGA